MGTKQSRIPMNQINELIYEGNLRPNVSEIIHALETAQNFLKHSEKEGLDHINTIQAIIS
jgi:hypothetical protein